MAKKLKKKLKKEDILGNLLTLKFFCILNLVLIVAMTGALLNLTAVAMNGGKMPVYKEEVFNTNTHFSFQDKKEVNKFYLADIYWGWSMGDIIIVLASIFLIISFYSTIKELKKLINSKVKSTKHQAPSTERYINTNLLI